MKGNEGDEAAKALEKLINLTKKSQVLTLVLKIGGGWIKRIN